MNGFFVELYLDEDVDVPVAELVRARGFHAMTTLETGGLGRSDEEQLDYAATESKTLLTHNRIDFEELAEQYFNENRTHSGIIIAVRRTPYEIASRLFTILDNVTADEMQNQLVYV